VVGTSGGAIRGAGESDIGSILAVFAHPDDEAYLAGALMAVAADAGRQVVCVTATRGELGFPDDDPRSIDERKVLREEELAACLEVLGVEDHRWLDYPDGGCLAVPLAEPVARITAIVEEVRPDSVLTFGPDGGTYHDDHISVSRWTTVACRAADGVHRLLFATYTPEWVERFTAHVPPEEIMMLPGVDMATTPFEQLALYFNADDQLADRKVRALRAQASQIEPLVEMAGVDRYRELVREEFFRAPTLADWPD
jgi:LmbE family N-acetylglucosaminyl deacetylase